MESELHQELLAVSLRVEQLLKGLLKTNQLEMIEKAKRFDPVFSISEWDISGFDTPDLTIKLSVKSIASFRNYLVNLKIQKRSLYKIKRKR